MIAIAVLVVIVVGVLALLASAAARKRDGINGARLDASVNAMVKLKASVDMFRASIPPHRLARGANEDDLHYYVGYITALAQKIAEADGISQNGTILATAQMEASRLCGTSPDSNGNYAEGIEILPRILSTKSANHGLEQGKIDGEYVINSNNAGPYFRRLRTRFDIQLPTQGSSIADLSPPMPDRDFDFDRRKPKRRDIDL